MKRYNVMGEHVMSRGSRFDASSGGEGNGKSDTQTQLLLSRGILSALYTEMR